MPIGFRPLRSDPNNGATRLCTCGCNYNSHTHTDNTRCVYCSCGHYTEAPVRRLRETWETIPAGSLIRGMYVLTFYRRYDGHVHEEWAVVTSVSISTSGGMRSASIEFMRETGFGHMYVSYDQPLVTVRGMGLSASQLSSIIDEQIRSDRGSVSDEILEAQWEEQRDLEWERQWEENNRQIFSDYHYDSEQSPYIYVPPAN